MIKLLQPLNHLGGLVKAGTTIYLGEKEPALVKSGVAEYVDIKPAKPAKPDPDDSKPSKSWTVKSLLEYAKANNIPDITGTMTKDEILAKIEAVKDNEKSLREMKKEELIDFALKLGIEDITDEMTEEEIISRIEDYDS